MQKIRSVFQWFKLDKKYLELYLTICFFSLLYIFPIILADIYYLDDMARAYYGATNWSGDGRPLAERLILLLCDGYPVTDIAPLTQIMAVFFLSYTLTVYARENMQPFSGRFMVVVVLLAIITNPFAMSNLSYRFDSIFMFIALGIPFLLFSLPKGISKIIFSFISLILCVVAMSMYQPVCGMFIALSVIDVVFAVMNSVDKEILKKQVCIIAGVGIGAIVYKVTIANIFILKDENNWRYVASQILELNFNFVSVVAANIKNCCKYIYYYAIQISPLNKLALTFVVLFTTMVFSFQYQKRNWQDGNRSAIRTIMIALSPLMVFIATFIPLTVLSSLRIKSRIFISFGAFLFFMGILLLHCSGKWRRIINVAFIICIFSHYSYMYTYCNALKSQNEYEKYLVYNIAHDLETINSKGDYSSFVFIGSTPKAKQTQNILSKYPFFAEIVPVNFGNSTWIGGVWVYHYLQGGLVLGEVNENDQQIIDSEDPILENTIYSCYANNEKIIICFH